MKKQTYSHITDELEDSTDESGDEDHQDSYEPKHSPIRRKEKFRTKDFKAKKKQKDRPRNLRSGKYDFEY